MELERNVLFEIEDFVDKFEMEKKREMAAKDEKVRRQNGLSRCLKLTTNR